MGGGGEPPISSVSGKASNQNPLSGTYVVGLLTSLVLLRHQLMPCELVTGAV